MRDITIPKANLRVHPILKRHQQSWLKFQAKVKEAEEDFKHDRRKEENSNDSNS